MNNVGGDGDPDDCGGGAGAVVFGFAGVAGGDGAPSSVAALAQERQALLQMAAQIEGAAS